MGCKTFGHLGRIVVKFFDGQASIPAGLILRAVSHSHFSVVAAFESKV